MPKTLNDQRLAQILTKVKAEDDSVRAEVSDFTEATRNINTAKMGRYGNAADGNIYDRDDKFYGMGEFIPVIAGDKYTFSFGGYSSESAMSWTYLFINDAGTNIKRAGYQNLNTRTITAPTGATKVNAFVKSDSTITLTESAHIQIENGEIQTEYIPAVSAEDFVLREKMKYRTMVMPDKVGAMLDTAEGYFRQAYGFVVGEESSLTHQTGRGLFHLNVLDDQNNPTIVCSEFVQALMKGIRYDQSRYVLPLNHMAQWGYTTDGIEDTEENGEPYDISYYNYTYDYVQIDPNDKPSYDYMVASQMYRYAKNHGWAYPITSIRQQIRPGDIVFNVEQDSPMYKGITHCAIVVNVGYDDGRCVVLESNNFEYDDHPVGVLLRNAAISSFAYGARFPIFDAPAIVKPIFKEENVVVSGSGTYTFWNRQRKDMLEPGFYTIVAHGSISENLVQASLRYSDETTSRFFRLVHSNDTYTVTFYAVKNFDYIALGCTAGATINLSEIALYKGYICADNENGIYGFGD